MVSLRPTPEEERRLALIERARGWKRAGLIDKDQSAQIQSHLTTSWKHGSLLSRIAFFFLTSLAVGALYGILSVADLALRGWVTAAFAIGLAELLISSRRFIHTGVEEGLYLTGLFCLIFPDLAAHNEQVLLLLAGASVVAGWRVLNAWFVVLGVGFGLLYVGAEFDPIHCGVVSTIAGIVALSLLPVPFRRPFHSSWLAGTALVTPLLVWGALRIDLNISLLYGLAVLSIVAAMVTLMFRLHSALLSALLSTSLLAFELSRRLSGRVETKLMVGGAFLFVIAVLVERWLRVPRRRFTSQKLIEPDSRLLDVAAIYSAASLVSPAAEVPQRQQDDGGFGGAGASGKF